MRNTNVTRQVGFSDTICLSCQNWTGAKCEVSDKPKRPVNLCDCGEYSFNKKMDHEIKYDK